MKHGFIRGLLGGVGWALALSLAALAVAAAAVPALRGGQALTVLTGSMQPTFNPGDRIITEAVAPAEVQVGDIITYLPNPDDPELITHRVIGTRIGADGTVAFIMQGDANSAADPVVEGKQIRFRYLYHIPYLGTLVEKAGGQSGMLVTGVAVAIIGYGIFLIVKPGRKNDPSEDGPAAAAPTPRRAASTPRRAMV
ncbi:MAG: signal peptidase I [Propionibacteriaceae bacterium]|jgi:signal peptidase|nr:signal peptidase I [Propionibacteriaceae bacterium]